MANTKAKGTPSCGKIKREIRNIKRLLKVQTLPPTVVQENERKLEMLNNKLNETKLNNITQKYKMVRFFEKRKLFRRLKKMKSEHDEDHPAIQKIRDHINYIVYYPIGEKYISLLPKEPYTDSCVIAKQKEILDSIKDRVQSGEIEDASLGTWSKDKNMTFTNAKALQAPDLSTKKRRIHSEKLPELKMDSEETDDFFIIDRGT